MRKKTLLIFGMLLIGTILFYSAKALQKQISETNVNPSAGSVNTGQQKSDNGTDGVTPVERDTSIEDKKDIQTEPENKEDTNKNAIAEPSSNPKSSNSSSSGSSGSNSATTGGEEQVQTPAPSSSQNGSNEKEPEKTPAPEKIPSQGKPNLKIIDTTNNDRIILQIKVNYDGSTSLLNIMKSELKKANIQASYKGAYISSIASLKERGAGPMSGWIFYINGKTSSIGAGDYYPKQGDTITWKYWKNALEENND